MKATAGEHFDNNLLAGCGGNTVVWDIAQESHGADHVVPRIRK